MRCFVVANRNNNTPFHVCVWCVKHKVSAACWVLICQTFCLIKLRCFVAWGGPVRPIHIPRFSFLVSRFTFLVSRIFFPPLVFVSLGFVSLCFNLPPPRTSQTQLIVNVQTHLPALLWMMSHLCNCAAPNANAPHTKQTQKNVEFVGVTRTQILPKLRSQLPSYSFTRHGGLLW